MDTSYIIKCIFCIAMLAMLTDICYLMVTTNNTITGYIKWTGQGGSNTFLMELKIAAIENIKCTLLLYVFICLHVVCISKISCAL